MSVMGLYMGLNELVKNHVFDGCLLRLLVDFDMVAVWSLFVVDNVSYYDNSMCFKKLLQV